MAIVKGILALIAVLVGVFFVIIAVRVLVYPPKGESGMDMILGSILLSLIPFSFAALLLKSLFRKKPDIAHHSEA